MLFVFGRRRRGDGGRVHGTYTLWIYLADWRIRDSRGELAHSESPDELIHRAAATLTRKKLEGIVLNTVVLRRKLRYGAVFHFTDGHSLWATMYDRSEDDDPIFKLYTPAACHSYRSNGTITSQAIEGNSREGEGGQEGRK